MFIYLMKYKTVTFKNWFQLSPSFKYQILSPLHKCLEVEVKLVILFYSSNRTPGWSGQHTKWRNGNPQSCSVNTLNCRFPYIWMGFLCFKKSRWRKKGWWHVKRFLKWRARRMIMKHSMHKFSYFPVVLAQPHLVHCQMSITLNCPEVTA